MRTATLPDGRPERDWNPMGRDAAIRHLLLRIVVALAVVLAGMVAGAAAGGQNAVAAINPNLGASVEADHGVSAGEVGSEWVLFGDGASGHSVALQGGAASPAFEGRCAVAYVDAASLVFAYATRGESTSYTYDTASNPVDPAGDPGRCCRLFGFEAAAFCPTNGMCEHVVSDRCVDGKPGCQSGLSLGPSAFRLDPDGVSTFERPYQGSLKPCLVPFAFSVPKRAPVASGPVSGLPACTATHTPNFGIGHWSIN